MIRAATLDDVGEISRLGELFHGAAGWGDMFAYSRADCARSLGSFIGQDHFLCFVADNDGIDGMIAGVLAPVYFNLAHMSGEEMFWWVAPAAPQMTGIRLLDTLESAAKAKGCETWQMKSIALLDGESMGKLYQRRGYRASELSFIKRL